MAVKGVRIVVRLNAYQNGRGFSPYVQIEEDHGDRVTTHRLVPEVAFATVPTVEEALEIGVQHGIRHVKSKYDRDTPLIIDKQVETAPGSRNEEGPGPHD